MAEKLDGFVMHGVEYDIYPTMKTSSISWHGLLVTFHKFGNLVRVDIFGTLNTNLTTNGVYAPYIVPPTGFECNTNSATYAVLADDKYGLVYMRTNGIAIGFTKNVSDGAGCNLVTGDKIFWSGTYIAA